MKKTAVAATLIISLIVAIRLFTFVTPPNSNALRFGATIPLTGPAASYGNEIRQGIELAVSDLGREGIRTQVAYENVSIPGPLAVSAVRSLLDRHEIEALVGNFYNPNIPVMAPALQRSRTITFHTAEADDKILASGEFIFSTNARIQDESAAMAALAVKRFHARTAAVLYVGTTFGEHYNLHFKKQFEALGGKVVYSALTALEERDMRPQLMQALAQKPDLLVTAYFGPGLGLVLKQAFALNAHQPIVTVYEAENAAVLETAGAIPNDRVYFYSPQPPAPRPHVARFRTAFETRFGMPPSLFSANAYDATVLAARALTACARDRSCARRQIAATKSYEGVSGTFSLGADGGATKDFVLKTVHDGGFAMLAQQ